jgi:3-oxoacyl-[acyl-carrier protein] reductase
VPLHNALAHNEIRRPTNRRLRAGANAPHTSLMRIDLDGRVAVVSGGSRGIGKGIALALVRAGCRVAICARGVEELYRATDEIEHAARQSGHGDHRALAVPLDMMRRDAALQFIDVTSEAFGAPDIVINNVGGNRRKPFDQTTDDDWDALLELNLLSGVRLARAAVPGMKVRRRGAILFITSIWGREAGLPDMSLYTATKAAANGAAKMMAIDLAPYGIRVNCIAPGSIRFPGGGWDRRMREDPDGMAKFVEQNMPLDRFGTVEEVADAAVFLVSDRAGLITGACVPVDGAQGRSLI